MEAEACSISISSVKTPSPRSRRKRRSSTSSTSLSPGSKENFSVLLKAEKHKRKRTRSESQQHPPPIISSSIPKPHFPDKLVKTFWGWSPKKAKFKPKVMDGDGSLSDHPDIESKVFRSKWHQPIVIKNIDF